MGTLFFNGNIITGDSPAPARSMFVVGHRITSISFDDTPAKGEPDKRVDLKGRTILPGLSDSHGHIFWTGLRHVRLQLDRCENELELVKLISSTASQKKSGDWITGEAWDQNRWTNDLGVENVDSKLPTSFLLSQAVKHHPVFLYRVDGHAALVNKMALDISGVNRSTPDPEGGLIVKDANGDPTGILLETAMDLVGRHVPPPSLEEKQEGLRLALKELASEGVTSFHECGADKDEIDLIYKFAASGQLTCRMHVMIDGAKKSLREEYFKNGPQLDLKKSLVQVRAIKLFVDGALGSRGALLSDDYTDAPGIKGVPIMDEAQIFQISTQAIKAGFQVATHAIGDLAGEIVLNAYENALKEVSLVSKPRLRIEHAQMASKAQIEKYKRLGVIASVQCCHCTSDMPWALSRLGEERLASKSYRWRSFVDAGVLVCNGSDTPVEPPKPFWGMHAAVTRRGRAKEGTGTDYSGGAEKEVLSRDQAFAAMTINAAWAAFWESDIGTLAQGKLADFIAVDRDPMKVPAEDIHKIKVEATWFGGELIYGS